MYQSSFYTQIMTKFESQPLDREAKPVLKLHSPMCECAECGAFFLGVGAFDRHSLGLGERCRTAEEMLAIGMAVNRHGVWNKGTSKRQHDADSEEN